MDTYGVISALICTNLRPLKCMHHIAWLPRASPLYPNGVITLLENGPPFMSNEVEIVNIGEDAEVIMCARSAPKIWTILTMFITNCGLSSNSVITCLGLGARPPGNFVHASVVFNWYKCRHRKDSVWLCATTYRLYPYFFKITIILLGARGEAPKSQAIWNTALVSNWYESAWKRQCVRSAPNFPTI